LDIDSAENLCKPSGNEPFVDQWVTTSAANQEQAGASDRSLASAHLVVAKGEGLPCGRFSASKERVREQSASPARCLDAPSDIPRPAHPSNRLVAQLNERWRVVDDPLQWILQRKKGNPRKKNSGWQGRSFCRTRDALLGCVAGHCGEVDDNSLAKLKSLPDWHPDWDRPSDRANLDVRRTDQAQGGVQSKSFLSQGLDPCEADDDPLRGKQSALS
jgi:hypothetical protein